MAAAANKPTKAQAAWAGLNERQRNWLRVIYGADQDEEEYRKGAYARGEEVVPASVWRWQEYSPTRRRRRGATADRGLLQAGLDELEIRDPGAGSTIKVLHERGLIEVRYYADDPKANRMAIKLTTHGRAVSRAGGADDVRPGRRNKARPLSEGLWRMFAEVAAAGDAGHKPRYGSHHPAWQRLVDLGLVVIGRFPDSGIRFTEAGREHYRGEWAGYVRTFPAVNAPHPDGEPVWPVGVDQELRRLKDACAELSREQLDVSRQAEKTVPAPSANGRGTVPELARASALYNSRVKLAIRTHTQLVEHGAELKELHRAAVGRYLAVAAAVVTAVAESTDPLQALNAEPLVLGMTTDLPYPQVGIIGADQGITTARPGTSHRRGKRAVLPPPTTVSTTAAKAYADHLADLAKGGNLTRLLLRKTPDAS